MKAYKVSLTYYLEAEDDVEARQIALGIKATDERVEIHAMEVVLRTERCQCCDQMCSTGEIVRRGSEQLCLTCDAEKYPIRDEDIPF